MKPAANHPWRKAEYLCKPKDRSARIPGAIVRITRSELLRGQTKDFLTGGLRRKEEMRNERLVAL